MYPLTDRVARNEPARSVSNNPRRAQARTPSANEIRIDEGAYAARTSRYRAALGVDDAVVMRERRNVKIRGLVQGVFFRNTVQRIAERHGIDGFVRNVGSDILEIEAEGEPQAVDAFIDDVRNNPPRMARVDDVRVILVPVTEEERGFFVERTAH
jgi:acylphosphatase